jgi:PilZ domain.
MFASLIRRKTGDQFADATNAAFESTTVSLSTAVPRPVERRADERVSASLRVGKLTTPSGEQQLIRIKNLSAGGLMAIVGSTRAVGDQVDIELSSQKIPASVVWTRDDLVGLKFDHNIDLRRAAGGAQAASWLPAASAALDIACQASVRVGKLYYNVEVHDISLGGMKVEPIEEYCVGKKVIVVVESLRPIKGEVRWYSDRLAGIVFDKPLDFEELTEWVGKRLDLPASRRLTKPTDASYFKRSSIDGSGSWPMKSQFSLAGASGAPKRCSSTSSASTKSKAATPVGRPPIHLQAGLRRRYRARGSDPHHLRQ